MEIVFKIAFLMDRVLNGTSCGKGTSASKHFTVAGISASCVALIYGIKCQVWILFERDQINSLIDKRHQSKICLGFFHIHLVDV